MPGRAAQDVTVRGARSLASVGAGLGAAVLVGGSLPVGHGWLPAVAGALAAWGIAVALERRIAGGAGPIAPLDATAGTRAALALATGLSSVVLLTLCVRWISGVWIAYPAAQWPVALWALVAVGVWRLPRRLGALGLVAACLGTVWTAGEGARFESQGRDARGWAHSGALLGTHPFQTTAIVVDGYGPFDLPFNDYVEPDGSRGYGAESLAKVLEEDLHAIAEQQFRQGPAQAYKAFSEAKVDPRFTAPVPERWGAPDPPVPSAGPPSEKDEAREPNPNAGKAPRFEVRSGTWGPRSSVEFVCPGQRNDPRPREPDPVRNRMCPDKYASEATAGLEVTGRWVGYAEGRGNERVSLGQAFGWTRSDDELGVQRQRRERRGYVLALIGLFAALAVVRGCGYAAALGRTLGAVASVGALAALTLVGAAVFGAEGPTLAALRPAVGGDLADGTRWAALAVVCAWPLLANHGAGGRPPGSRAAALTAVWVAAVALIVARPEFAARLVPDLWSAGGSAGVQWVAGLADALARVLEIDVQRCEAVVAALAIAGVAGCGLQLAVGAGGWSGELLVGKPSPWAHRGGAWMVLLGVAALEVSVHTRGAATLWPTALALGATVTAALAQVRRSSPATAVLTGLLATTTAVLAWIAVGRGVPTVFAWAMSGLMIASAFAVFATSARRGSGAASG